MKLVHYSKHPELAPRPVPLRERGGYHDRKSDMKPRGLWVSDDATKYNWRWWCEGERFGLERLEYAFHVKLKPKHRILVLKSAAAILRFHREFMTQPVPGSSLEFIRWPAVARRWQGIIITPYQWDMRFDMRAFWYYGWDCASGCIWDTDCIAEARPLGKVRRHHEQAQATDEG